MNDTNYNVDDLRKTWICFVLDLQVAVSDYILFVVYQVEKNKKENQGVNNDSGGSISRRVNLALHQCHFVWVESHLI